MNVTSSDIIISTKNLSWKAGTQLILDNINIEILRGKTIGLLGPNGSGKSSLLRILAGLAPASSGNVNLDGNIISNINKKTLAKRLAFVAQNNFTEANISVFDVVALGRIAHNSLFSSINKKDYEVIYSTLERVDMLNAAKRNWQQLSGGEKQRVHIARALAQEPSEILLDEPCNHLDIAHQLQLMKLISNLPITCIIAIHDLNHAMMFCDFVIVLKAGKVAAAGEPSEVLNCDLLANIFDVKCKIEPSPAHGKKHIHFLV